MNDDPGASRPRGLDDSLRQFGRSVLRMLQTRLEIFSTELAEERFNLTRLALVALAALVCLQVGLFLALMFVVLLVGPENRLLVVGISALVLLGATAGMAFWLGWWLKRRPPMFEATIGELKRDRERLGGEG